MGPKGGETENIKIEYLNGASIYVPIDKIDKIHKYQGLNDKNPKLSDLSSSAWEKQRNITKKSAENVVDKLIELYKLREKPRGFIYNTKGSLINELEQSFPHQETEDQRKSIEEIFKDMEKNKIEELLNEAEKEITKAGVSDQMKYLVDQKILVLKSIN